MREQCVPGPLLSFVGPGNEARWCSDTISYARHCSELRVAIFIMFALCDGSEGKSLCVF